MEFNGSIIELASKSTASLDKHAYPILSAMEKLVQDATSKKSTVFCSRYTVQGRTINGTMRWGELPVMSFTLELDNKAELGLWIADKPDSVRSVFDLAKPDVGTELDQFYDSNKVSKPDYRESLYNKANDEEARYAITVAASQFAKVLNEHNVSLVYDDGRQDFAVVPTGVKVSYNDGGIPDEAILDERRFLHVDLPVTGGICLDDQCLAVSEDYSE